MDDGNGFFDGIPEEAKAKFLWREHRAFREDVVAHRERIYTKISEAHTMLRDIQLWRAEIRGGRYVAGLVGGIVGAVIVGVILWVITKGG